MAVPAKRAQRQQRGRLTWVAVVFMVITLVGAAPGIVLIITAVAFALDAGFAKVG
jgi:hypothetical protein